MFKHLRYLWESFTYFIRYGFTRKRIRSAIAAIVVFTTVYTLIMPAIALEQKNASDMAGLDLPGQVLHQYACALEAHKHTDDCYKKKAVYDADGNKTGTKKVLNCGKADWVVHTHDENCYQDGVLVCTLPEHAEHVHTDACYSTKKKLVCDLPEGEEHTHTDACYTEERVLTCGESALHTHTVDCYEKGPNGESPVDMGWVSVSHDEYGNEIISGDPKHLICGQLELLAHQHSDACFIDVEVPAEEISEWAAEEPVDELTEQPATGEGFEGVEEQPYDTDAYAEGEGAPDQYMYDEGTDGQEQYENSASGLDQYEAGANGQQLNEDGTIYKLDESEPDPNQMKDIEVVTDEDAEAAEKNEPEDEAEQDAAKDKADQDDDLNDGKEKDDTEIETPAGERTIEVEDASYSIHVSWPEESGIPEGAEFRATVITEKRADYDAYRERALAAVDSYTTEENRRAEEMPGLFDLTIYDSDGEEIQPKAPLSISIDFGKDIADDATGVYAVHFPGTGVDTVMNPIAGNPVARAAQIVAEKVSGTGPEVIETSGKGGEVEFETGSEVEISASNDAKPKADETGKGQSETGGEVEIPADYDEQPKADGDEKGQSETDSEVEFEAESLSVYAIVYTVDLRYDAETGTLSYEDSKIKVTVSPKENEKDVFPDEAVLSVKEMIPDDADAADIYAQALTSLTKSLREQNCGFSAAKVYDFSILDKEGNEIEPNGEVAVKIEYKEKPELRDSDRSVSDIQIAHLVEDSSDEEKMMIELVDAEIDATALGTVSGAEFTTDSFSAYIVFNRDGISNQEPTDLGSYGWIRFNTVGEQDTTPNQTGDPDSPTIQWGYYKNDGSNLPALNTQWAYRRILKVRLWLPKSGQDSSVYDSDHYNEAATAQYFWVWQNEVNIEEFEMPGYEVVHTRMHTAWDEENGKEPVENDSLVGSYNVRGYRRSTLIDEPGAKNSDLNVLDIYAKQLPQITGMNYIIRYVHADGSVTDGNVRSLASGSVTYDASQYKRNGEVYAGTSIVTGSEAINANTADGTGTITYKSNVSLAKVYVYYKIDPKGNGNPNTKGRYDKDENGYYTGEKGLYTDKSAETVSGNDRQFVLNLESWYVDNAASVGMVLDASGSMAWTSGAPEPVILTSEQLGKSATIDNSTKYVRDYTGNYADGAEVPDNKYIPYALLSQILDKNKTDNSSMGYNGYHYYLKDERSTVKEYVALGYTDGNLSSDNTWTRLKGSSGYNNGNDMGFATVSRWLTSSDQNDSRHTAGGVNQGWYYVNSTGRVDRYLTHTGKSYDGYAINNNGNPSSKGPLRFYVKNGNELWVAFWDNTTGNRRVVHSPVYEKRDKMFTKMETLQDAVSQFGAILLGSNPDSEIAMSRFSQNIDAGNDQLFTSSNYLPLLNWTGNTVDVSTALAQSIGSYGGKNRSDDGLTVYEYGLTGQTRTWTGVKAYSDYLKNSATAANHKYIIVFTDGKDTNGDADSSTWGATGTQIQQLKNDGYTVITVMMRSQAMVGSEYTTAKAFLQGIASPGLDGNASNTAADNKLYFEADSNSTKDVIDAFRKIASRIASGLSGYTVRDYIDPRFDVVNDAGDVLTVLDSNGQFTNATNPDVDAVTGLRGFTTPDNKHAYLGYDPVKKMFYVLWKDQEIPASTVKSTSVNPWKSQIRIQAKEDFLGGNDILSNGNETGMNQVYYPDSTDPSGMTPKIDTTNYPSKDFPKTTTDPGTLAITLSNYEDTIFLGETISPASLFESVQTKRDSETDYRSMYFNYLMRAGQKFQNDPTYYVGLLKNGAVPPGASNTDPSKDKNGNDIPDFVFTSDENGVTALTLPYYYLENFGDASSYAGGTLHQEDKVGKVTYSWKATDTGSHTLTDNNALLDYESVTLDTVRYRLSVTYTPDEAKYDSLDVNGNVVGDGGIPDNGSARTLKLTGQYGTDKLIKDPVGEQAQTQTTITNPESMGLAAIHVVAGKIKITKRIEVTEAK